MGSSILVNLREAFLTAPGFWESCLNPKLGNWCKLVEGIDRSQTDGYSIEGPFVSQIDQSALQVPGLYLYCQKGRRKRGNCDRLYTLFVLEPDGTVKVIHEMKTASRDWAIELWPPIEAYFNSQTQSVEKRRQQLLAEIESLEFHLSQRRSELLALETNYDGE